MKITEEKEKETIEEKESSKKTKEKKFLTESEKLEQNIKKWKDEYYSIYSLEISGYKIIFRPLNRAEYKIFRKTIDEMTEDNYEEAFSQMQEDVVKLTVLYPEAEELDKSLKCCGGLNSIIADNIFYYSGFSKERVEKL